MFNFKFMNNFERFVSAFLIYNFRDKIVLDPERVLKSYVYIEKHKEVSKTILNELTVNLEDVFYGLIVSPEILKALIENINTARIMDDTNSEANQYKLCDNEAYVDINLDITDEQFGEWVDKISVNCDTSDAARAIKRKLLEKADRVTLDRLSYVVCNFGFLLFMANINVAHMTDLIYKCKQNVEKLYKEG